MSFPETDRKTQDITQSISELNLSPSPEDKKDSQSIGQENPFLKMMSFEEESQKHGPVPIFAQIARQRDPPVRPDMGSEFFSKMAKIEAMHQLS